MIQLNGKLNRFTLSKSIALAGALAITLAILTSASQSFAQADEFDENETYGTEEAVLKVPGGKVKKMKKGRMRPSRSTEEVGNIYQGDVERLSTRVRSKQFTSFSFGPFGITAPKDGGGMLYGGAVAKHWEASSMGEIRVRLSGAGGTGGSFANLGLGGAFIPVRSSVSPIIGAEFGGGAVGGENSGAGFSLSAYTGMRFFRLADAQMEILASYSAILAEKAPGAFGINLGMLF